MGRDMNMLNTRSTIRVLFPGVFKEIWYAGMPPNMLLVHSGSRLLASRNSTISCAVPLKRIMSPCGISFPWSWG